MGHISPSNLCELQIRPFRPLLLTFMNRKLGGTPNICARLSFLLTQRIFLCSVGRPNVLGTEPKRYLFIIINLVCSGVDIYSKKRLCKVLKDCAQNLSPKTFTKGRWNENYLGHIWAHTSITPFTKLSPYLAHRCTTNSTAQQPNNSQCIVSQRHSALWRIGGEIAVRYKSGKLQAV